MSKAETNDSTSTESVGSSDSDTDSEAFVKAPLKDSAKSVKESVKKSVVKSRNKTVEKKTGTKKEQPAVLSTKVLRLKAKQRKTKKVRKLKLFCGLLEQQPPMCGFGLIHFIINYALMI